MIRQFNVIVTRTDEYTVQIDDEIYNEEWMNEFARYMWKLNGIEDIAKALAWHQMRNGDDRFLEGFGNITRDGELPIDWNRDFDKEGKLLPVDERDKPAPGLNINLDDQDEDYEFQIKEEQYNDKS